MATSSKPPITLQIKIQTLGKQEDVAALFAALTEMGVMARSLDVTLNAGYYFVNEGRDAQRQVVELLKSNLAVYKAKSGAKLSLDWKADDVLLEERSEDDEPDGDEEEDDETPIERALRDLAPDGHGVSEVTLSSGDRTATLTPETRASAERALRSLSWPATAGADDDE